MTVWISFLGDSPMAVVNTLWLAYRAEEVKVSKVYLIINNDVREDNLRKVKDEIALLYECEVIKKECIQTDFDSIGNILQEIINHEGSKNIIMDITAGRKFMSAIALKVGIDRQISKIYYLYLENPAYINKRYDEIPVVYENLYNLGQKDEE